MTNVAKSVMGLYEHYLMPNQAHNTNTETTMASIDRIDFGFYNRYIRPEYVTIIDDFFSMFGYATKRVKVPNRNVRPHWCYTKTIGCHINGSIPQDDVKRICAIYDNGITFWKNGEEVGNYNLDNSI